MSKETTDIGLFEICIFANNSFYKSLIKIVIVNFTTLTDKLSLFAPKALSNGIAQNYHVVHIFV